MAIGDVDGDGYADIITGAGGGPHVEVFDGRSLGLNPDGVRLHRSFYAFDPAFVGGVHVGASDFTGDGCVEIIVGAGPGGGPHVRVLDSDLNQIDSFYAFDKDCAGGVFGA